MTLKAIFENQGVFLKGALYPVHMTAEPEERHPVSAVFFQESIPVPGGEAGRINVCRGNSNPPIKKPL